MLNNKLEKELVSIDENQVRKDLSKLEIESHLRRAKEIYQQLNPEELALAGVSEDMVRISVGIEHIDDIIQDVEQAIEASKK